MKTLVQGFNIAAQDSNLNDEESKNLDLYSIGDIHMYTNVIVCDILVDQCDSIWVVIPLAESCF